MKTIIIPTDFSAAATSAINYGVNMAKEIGASITLLHTYMIPVSTNEVPVMVISDEELAEASGIQLNKVKGNIDHITSGSVKVNTETRLGDLADELEDLCEQIKPFAIIMGKSGASEFENILFGSSTLKVIRHLKWPVIAVPTGKEYGNGIKKVGFACDYRQVVQTTPTQLIRDFVNQFNAEFYVLNVDYENRHFKPDVPEQSLLLHKLLEGLQPVYDFIEDADIEDGINSFAEKNNLDLIITIPKKHKLLDNLFKKSSTKQLLVQSHIPLMCIHE